MKNRFLQVYIAVLVVLFFGCSTSSDGNGNSNTINVPNPSVTDIDGNIYQSVTNCGLTFTKQNLNVSKYSDGTPIPQITDPTQWSNLTTGAWCYYNNDHVNGTMYNKLYNWYAVAGIYDAASAANPAIRKKLAPTGWHIPTDAEWNSLINCLDSNANGGIAYPNVAGSKMKETGITHWYSPNSDATNSSSFTGLPGGYRKFDGTFNDVGKDGLWWSLSQSNTASAWIRLVDYSEGSVFRGSLYKFDGLSVRCIRD